MVQHKPRLILTIRIAAYLLVMTIFFLPRTLFRDPDNLLLIKLFLLAALIILVFFYIRYSYSKKEVLKMIPKWSLLVVLGIAVYFIKTRYLSPSRVVVTNTVNSPLSKQILQ
jgi:hypothetical protein